MIREALWAVIQSLASDIDFDYGRYARENFDAYRAARLRLPAWSSERSRQGAPRHR